MRYNRALTVKNWIYFSQIFSIIRPNYGFFCKVSAIASEGLRASKIQLLKLWTALRKKDKAKEKRREKGEGDAQTEVKG